MPVRKIPKSHSNVTGIAASRKASGPAAFESTLERDLIQLLEFDPDVIGYEVQPVSITWFDAEGAKRIYTPDILAKYADLRRVPCLMEVKYRKDLRENWQELKPKFKAAIRYAKSLGWRFQIVTEKEIRTERVANVRFLLGYLRQTVPAPHHTDSLLKAMQQLRHSTPKELLATLNVSAMEQATLLPSLWYLIAQRQIVTDLDRRLTMASPIWWPSHG